MQEMLNHIGFNTQPPEGGWFLQMQEAENVFVSTHSRLKAAGDPHLSEFHGESVSTHSRLKAAGSFESCGV